MKTRLSSSHDKESGFTLVEVAVGLAVGMFLLVTTIQFLTHTVGVITKLNTQRDIRDQGLMAVETIEREFRKVLEYGGNVETLTQHKVTANKGTHKVSVEKNGQRLILSVDDGVISTTEFPSGDLSCDGITVEWLEDDEGKSRVIVVGFGLKDDRRDISRWFKAAFSSVYATGS